MGDPFVVMAPMSVNTGPLRRSMLKTRRRETPARRIACATIFFKQGSGSPELVQNNQTLYPTKHAAPASHMCKAVAMTMHNPADNPVHGMPVANENDLSLVMQGHLAFQTLYAGHELGIFTYLAAHPGATRDDMAAATGLADRPTTFLLSALRTLGLITGPDTALRNTAVAEKHLVDGQPESYSSILNWYHALVYPLASGLTDSLRHDTNMGLDQLAGEGSTVYERLAGNAELQKIFHLGMSAISQMAVGGLVHSNHFARHRRLLDVGAGDATNSIALVRAHKHLASVLVDLPSVLDLAPGDKIADSGVRDIAWSYARPTFSPIHSLPMSMRSCSLTSCQYSVPRKTHPAEAGP